jgi:hypothetical protein
MILPSRVWHTAMALTVSTGFSPLPAQILPQRAEDGTALVRIAPPNSEMAWACANYQVKDTWQVAYEGDSTRIWRTGPADARPVQMSVPRGTLVGYNSGEFGGQLVFRDSQQLDEKTILKGNPVALFRQSADTVILVEGLGHMGVRSGHVIALVARQPGGWKVAYSINIGTAPDAAIVLNDTVLIATSDGVLGVSLRTRTVNPVFRNENWHLLYATTIVRLPDQTILVGMRRAVAALVPGADGYREEWLVPTSCRDLTGPHNGPCSCSS